LNFGLRYRRLHSRTEYNNIYSNKRALMSIRAKILVSIAALLVLIACFGPSLLRCYMYHKFIADRIDRFGNSEGNWYVSALNTISHKPVKIEIPPSNYKNNFSLGYAEFYLDQNDVCEITIINEQMVLIKCDTYGIGFFPPTETIVLPSDKNDHSKSKPESLPKDLYQALVKAAYAGPKTYLQIFSMPTYKFNEYMELCMFKTMFGNNQNGIGIFETDRIKGLIGFGEVQFPNKMVINVFSADSAINQNIVVRSDSPEKTRKIVMALLSSYNYLIEKPMNDSDLQKVIFDKVSVHPLFRKDNPEEAK
jgi:hypothetical protein